VRRRAEPVSQFGGGDGGAYQPHTTGLPMSVLDTIGRGLDEAFFMVWATLWALVLGFGLSGAVQAFVSRAEMQRALGNHRPLTVVKAGLFGAISSSCSYAASALAKTLFARGADFTSAMVFMVASTNLVVELGIVLWLLIGWKFAVAEFVGGTIMIVLLAILLPRVVPPAWLEQARARLNEAGAGGHEHHGEPETATVVQPWRARIRSRAGWSDAAGYTISDLTMLRRELFVGFLVAGFLATLVPNHVWQSLFLTGHGIGSSAENVVLGPFLAIISFVCSIGNVPLAAALWKGGISFGGVVSFVFADLISLPLLLIYRRYYGSRLTLRVLAAFWLVMSVAGLATEYLFKAIRIAPSVHPKAIVDTAFHWDYTTILDIIALAAFAGIYWLYRHRDSAGGSYAKDVVCGMQVETVHAPARTSHSGKLFLFCSDRCRDRFTANPDRYAAGTAAGPMTDPGTTIDPVCGMHLDPKQAHWQLTYGGGCYPFCSAGCRDAFTADPSRFVLPKGPQRH